MSMVIHLASRTAAPHRPELATAHDPVRLHAEAHNALSMALHYLREPQDNTRSAMRKAVQALAALRRLDVLLQRGAA
ncbi:hypothetical protein [Oryzisolibacter sp. LB2S]|uniref:hypothetical protein n=1 Tax=Alicycliphilus soli TaxID=3228789 RepID=UPI00345830AC